MSSSLFKDEKRTQYSPLMTREEQVRDRDDGRRATMGRWETIWLDDADETTARARCDGFGRTEGGGAIDARTEARGFPPREGMREGVNARARERNAGTLD